MKTVNEVVKYINGLIKEADRDAETATKLSQRNAGRKKGELLRRIKKDVQSDAAE